MKKKQILICALACAALLGITIPTTIQCCHEAAKENFCRNNDYFELCACAALEDDGYCRDDVSEWFVTYDARTAFVITKDAKLHCFKLKEPQPWVFVWREI